MHVDGSDPLNIDNGVDLMTADVNINGIHRHAYQMNCRR